MRRRIIRLCCAFLLLSGAQLVHAGETRAATRLSSLASWSTAKEKSGTTPLFVRGDRILEVITDPAKIPAARK